MFGIGMSEALVIGLVVIVFVRPRDLPVFFRKLGAIYADVRRFYKELVDTKVKLIKDIESAVDVENAMKPSVEVSAQEGIDDGRESSEAT